MTQKEKVLLIRVKCPLLLGDVREIIVPYSGHGMMAPAHNQGGENGMTTSLHSPRIIRH